MPNHELDSHYIEDARYELLLQAILNPKPTLDPRGQLIETLGEIGDLWPMSCLADRDPEEMAEAAFSAMKSSLNNDLSDEDEKVFEKGKRLMIECYAEMIALAKTAKAA